MDQRFNIRNRVTSSSYDPQADYEFKCAKYLSPHHHSVEVDKLLDELARLKKEVSAIKDTRSYEKGFYLVLLNKRWHPPVHEGCLITRCDYSYADGKLRLEISSGSPAFDTAAMQVLKTSVDEYPFLSWGFNNSDYAFMSEGSEWLVADNRQSITKCGFKTSISAHEKAQSEDMFAYLKENLTAKLLNQYCQPDALHTYQIAYRPSAPLIYFDRCNFKITDGSRPIDVDVRRLNATDYVVQVDQKWHIDFNSNYRPTGKELNNYLSRERIRNALFSSMANWQIVHEMTASVDEWSLRQPDYNKLQEKLLEDASGKAAAYTCRLKSGKRVRAQLKEDTSIESIIVDGVVDKLWQEAYQSNGKNGPSALKLLY